MKYVYVALFGHTTLADGSIISRHAGKDTAYSAMHGIISGGMGLPTYRLAFGDELKRELADAMGVSIDWLERHKDELRQLIMHWGTEFRRKFFGETYWIERASANLAR